MYSRFPTHMMRTQVSIVLLEISPAAPVWLMDNCCVCVCVCICVCAYLCVCVCIPCHPHGSQTGTKGVMHDG